MDILKWATEIESEVIAWRRKIYEHPELSDYEFETLALIRQVLTEAGVRIYEYSPGFIHSKVYLVDDRYAVAGTVNLDFRSLYLHYENAVFLFEASAVAEIGEDFQKTFPVCEEITWRKCRKTGLPQRLLAAALRLFSPLM